jgi:hypothetical protein
MADHIIPGRDTTKIGVRWKKISAFFSKRAIWIGLTFILLGFVMIAFRFIHKTPHQQAAKIVQAANQSAVNGKFNDVIQQLLQAYSTENKTIVKAGIAYKIGVKYYQTGSNAEGKKWLETASDDYKKAGDSEGAAAAQQEITTLEGAQKINNMNSSATGQSANNRGNIQDGNL